MERFVERLLIAVALAVVFLATAQIHDARAAESIMDRLAVSDDATKCVTITAAYTQGMWFYGEGHELGAFPLPDGVEAGSDDAEFFIGLTEAGWKTMQKHIEQAHAADLKNAEGTEWEGKVTFNRAQGSIIAPQVYRGLRDQCNAGGGWHVVKDLTNFDAPTLQIIEFLLGPERGRAI